MHHRVDVFEERVGNVAHVAIKLLVECVLGQDHRANHGERE